MIKSILWVTLLFLTLPAAALDRETCESYAELGESIMALRQAGAPIETANEIVAGGPEAFEELVKRIYTAPVLENKEKQKDLIKASYTKWLNECLSVI